MKRAWQVSTLGFALLGAVMLVESLRYPILDRLGPGPGFFPLGLSLLTIAAALGLLLRVSLERVPEVAAAPPRDGGRAPRAGSVVTCLDGYQMARQGRAGPALAIAAIGSFIEGTVATFDRQAKTLVEQFRKTN
jgi:hypothetical protein